MRVGARGAAGGVFGRLPVVLRVRGGDGGDGQTRDKRGCCHPLSHVGPTCPYPEGSRVTPRVRAQPGSAPLYQQVDMAPLALQEGRRNQTRSSSFGKWGEKVAADFSQEKGRVRDERERREQAEGLDSGGVKGEVGAGDPSESRKAPDGGGVSKLPPPSGKAISQDPLIFKMNLLFNPATPLLEVCLGLVLGQGPGLGLGRGVGEHQAQVQNAENTLSSHQSGIGLILVCSTQ